MALNYSVSLRPNPMDRDAAPRAYANAQINGELGKFRLQTVSEGTETLTDFTAAHIAGVNIQHIPSEDLKTIFATLEFEPVASRSAQAAALRSEKEGKAVADLLKTPTAPEA